jgi:hypothetical protein
METRDFGWALKQLKQGFKVAREGWNGKGMFLYLEDMLHSIKDRDLIKDRIYEPVIVMFTAQNTHQPGWRASQTDMLSEACYVVE